MCTCALPVVIRAYCPKMKYHPLSGWIIIYIRFTNIKSYGIIKKICIKKQRVKALFIR